MLECRIIFEIEQKFGNLNIKISDYNKINKALSLFKNPIKI